MSDRVAIVVGAGGLLGRTGASKLAADGFTVVGVDRSEEGLRELPDRTVVGDATDPAVAKPLIERIVAEYGLAAYSLGKAALTHLIRVLDLELRPKGIRVNAVAPQLIDNPRNRSYFPAEVMAHSVTPEAIAQVIAFLAGNASAPVSGAILPTYGA